MLRAGKKRVSLPLSQGVRSTSTEYLGGVLCERPPGRDRRLKCPNPILVNDDLFFLSPSQCTRASQTDKDNRKRQRRNNGSPCSPSFPFGHSATTFNGDLRWFVSFSSPPPPLTKFVRRQRPILSALLGKHTDKTTKTTKMYGKEEQRKE